MRKFYLLVVMFMVVNGVSAQSFDESKLRVGGGLVYCSNVSNLGLQFNGVYQFTNEWEGAIGYSHIFENNNLSYNILEFDAHYIFHEQDSRLNFYGIGGLAFTFVKYDYPIYIKPGEDIIQTNYTNSTTKVGINLGVGCNYKLADNLNLASEFRYTSSDGSYVRLGASIQYMF
ncbi:outer membrane protein [Saccharicrinis aurantiacus]|uniref:outer membrane protein n=1 Tax=Saccharicrinis aurantiacus TaxID=1849719 RepID=UPI002493BC8B|nr:outer membrane beta-barrel protein [Saccharicrinis aurantiacus]